MPRRPPPPERPWTAAELDALRRRYVSDGAAALAAELKRSVRAVQNKAKRLRILRRPRWTTRQDDQLRNLWESGKPLRAIARHIGNGRTPLTTYWRARQLGLETGCPRGMEYLSHAAKRTGYQTGQLREILRWACVKLHLALARPTKTRRHYHYVDPALVDDAVRRWHETEPVESAAIARGIAGTTLRAWLLVAGVRPERGHRAHSPWRVETAVIDRVVEERRGRVSLMEAARQLEVDRSTLARRLAKVGMASRGRRWRVRLDEVRAVLAREAA